MNDVDRRFLLGGLAGAAGVTALGAMARGGPINPPAGVVASSGKTLSEVEPRTAVNAANTPGDATAVYIISQPGSYMLTGNITAVSGKHAIKITTSDITLDLCGFKIGGVAGSGDGINAAINNRNMVIRNGTIADCGGGGINNNGSNDCCFSDLQLYNNALGGLATGTDALVERVSVKGGTVGISVGDRSRVTACEVTGITSGGTGISSGPNCVLTGCVSVTCAGPCIDAGSGTLLRDCNGSNSTASHGIRLNYGAIATGCAANSNFLNGFEALQRNKILDCLAVGNTQCGIHSVFIGHVHGCFCESNGQCGILIDAGGGVTIRNNTCVQNGTSSGAGIRAANVGINVIEGNSVSANYRGIDVLSARNFIAGNRAYGNTNADYSIVAGNTYGPLINAAGVGDITATANANHPHANFRF